MKTIPTAARNPITDQHYAYALLRLILGVDMLMHGLSRMLSGPSKFAAGMEKQFAPTILPVWSVHAFALTLPWVELLLGVLILTGLATRYALIAGSLLMAALMFGICLTQQWEVAGLQLVYGLVFSLLLFYRSHNRLAIDHFLESQISFGVAQRSSF